MERRCRSRNAAPMCQSVLILIWAHILAVRVVVAAVVVVAVVVVAVGSRGCRSDRCGAIGGSPTAIISSRITSDRTTRTTGIVASAGVNACTTGVHARTAASASVAAATAAAAGKRLVRNHCRANQHERC